MGGDAQLLSLVQLRNPPLVRDFIAFLYTGKEDNYYCVVSNKKNKFSILCILKNRCI